MAGSVEAWVEAYRQAWESRDPDAAAALFTEDATYRDRIFDEPHRGPDGVAAYWANVTRPQSEVQVRIGKPFVDGKRVAVEFWTNFEVDGEDATLPGCLLLDFDDDWKCTRLREYWLFEPGRHEPPAEWGT